MFVKLELRKGEKMSERTPRFEHPNKEMGDWAKRVVEEGPEEEAKDTKEEVPKEPEEDTDTPGLKWDAKEKSSYNPAADATEDAIAIERAKLRAKKGRGSGDDPGMETPEKLAS